MIAKKYVIKVLIGGNGGVGKTSLLNRYVSGTFVKKFSMTVGVAFYNKSFNLSFNSSSAVCSLQLWDLGGQERFRFLITNYVLGAKLGLILFDITNFTSFDDVKKWERLLRSRDKELPLLLVGTKCDLIDAFTIEDADALALAKKLKCFGYLKTSSRYGVNIDKVFKFASEYYLKNVV